MKAVYLLVLVLGLIATVIPPATLASNPFPADDREIDARLIRLTDHFETKVGPYGINYAGWTGTSWTVSLPRPLPELEILATRLDPLPVAFVYEPRAEPAVCNNRNDCIPVRGGVDANGATLNMWSKKDPWNGYTFWLWTGHYGGPGADVNVYHGSQLLGSTGKNALWIDVYGDNTGIDASRIPTTTLGDTSWNKLYLNDINMSYSMTARGTGTLSPEIGETACITGKGSTTNPRCASVSVERGRYQGAYGTRWAYGAKVNGSFFTGDSGAPIYGPTISGHTYFGVASTKDGWFALVGDVQHALNVLVCITSSCF